MRGRGIAARRAKRGRQPEKKKETARKARANEICVGLTTQKYDWWMSEALTTTCQQSKMMAEALQECLSENRSIRRSYLRDRNLNTQSLSRLALSRLQSRAWSFACLVGFAQRTKKKERLLLVYGALYYERLKH